MDSCFICMGVAVYLYTSNYRKIRIHKTTKRALRIGEQMFLKTIVKLMRVLAYHFIEQKGNEVCTNSSPL